MISKAKEIRDLYLKVYGYKLTLDELRIFMKREGVYGR